VTGAGVVGLSCTVAELAAFTESAELTATVEFILLGAGVTGAGVVVLACTVTGPAAFIEYTELTATPEFTLLGAEVIGAGVVVLACTVTGPAAFTVSAELSAAPEFTDLCPGCTRATFFDLPCLLTEASAFAETDELRAAVDFTAVAVLVVGADVVRSEELLVNWLKLNEPSICGFASTVPMKDTITRSICKTESKIFTVRTCSVLLFAEYHLGRGNSSK
jgi:hypothetical protein